MSYVKLIILVAFFLEKISPTKIIELQGIVVFNISIVDYKRYELRHSLFIISTSFAIREKVSFLSNDRLNYLWLHYWYRRVMIELLRQECLLDIMIHH